MLIIEIQAHTEDEVPAKSTVFAYDEPLTEALCEQCPDTRADVHLALDDFTFDGCEAHAGAMLISLLSAAGA